MRFLRNSNKRLQTLRYDVYLTCSKSWQVASLVHHTEQTKKLKCETKNKTMTAVSYHAQWAW